MHSNILIQFPAVTNVNISLVVIWTNSKIVIFYLLSRNQNLLDLSDITLELIRQWFSMGLNWSTWGFSLGSLDSSYSLKTSPVS